ncbi:MAG: aldo/keto reductase [Clostridia bacterium]|nr:aldo/keto reductase [Clostridia bacterium]
MNSVRIGQSNIEASRIALGCMRINNLNIDEAEHLIKSALELGINFFDHADIYAYGYSEELFGRVIKNNPLLREKMFIQSKCGIIRRSDVSSNIAFDFSEKHIIEAVDGSLSRLNTEYLDVLLLHRPDALVEPEEVASAFEKLKSQGKVKNFGVSNQTPMQIELLKKYVKVPLIANQLQLNVVECGMINQGLNTNMRNAQSFMHDGSIMEYSRINNMTIQAWSPLQVGLFEGTYIDNPDYAELNDSLQSLADKYNVTKTAIAIAWILRHPAKCQVIVGTTKYSHLLDLCSADSITLTKEEWYDLYKSAGHPLP